MNSFALEKYLDVNSIILLNADLTQFKNPVGFRNEPVCVKRFDLETGSKYILKFSESSLVTTQTIDILRRFLKNLKNVQSSDDLITALSKFYFEFVFVVHPFKDGNGRTAKRIIADVVNYFNGVLLTDVFIQNYSLTGNIRSDFHTFTQIMKDSLFLSSTMPTHKHPDTY